ncbi:hypothetical protein ACRRTK_019023 [Alexandromys fortis]
MDVKKNLTQSNGTVGFITLKYIYGDDEEEQKLVDVMENQIMDFQKQLACLCYTYDYESLKSYYLGHNKKNPQCSQGLLMVYKNKESSALWPLSPMMS